MTVHDRIQRGTLVLASLDNLYLCPELGCRAVSNIAEECPVCFAKNVLALAGLVDRRVELAEKVERITAEKEFLHEG